MSSLDTARSRKRLISAVPITLRQFFKYADLSLLTTRKRIIYNKFLHGGMVRSPFCEALSHGRNRRFRYNRDAMNVQFAGGSPEEKKMRRKSVFVLLTAGLCFILFKLSAILILNLILGTLAITFSGWLLNRHKVSKTA